MRAPMVNVDETGFCLLINDPHPSHVLLDTDEDTSEADEGVPVLLTDDSDSEAAEFSEYRFTVVG
jgi:hypothetical protein